MSPAKLYTIYLEVKAPDGSLVTLSMRATPIGSFNTRLASLSIQLAGSLERRLNTLGLEVVDSLHFAPVPEPEP